MYALDLYDFAFDTYALTLHLYVLVLDMYAFTLDLHDHALDMYSLALGFNIFYFLNKYDNISVHCNLQITGSERKQEYLYSSSPEHIKFVEFTGRILNIQYKVY